MGEVGRRRRQSSALQVRTAHRGVELIEEKLIRKRATITVGTGTRNTIILPAANAPKSFSLFELRGNDYFLGFTDEMSGRVSVGEQAADLQSLKAQNLVRKAGNVYSLKLNESARGRVSVGECILLFQFVNPPPEPVRPQLPSVVREVSQWLPLTNAVALVRPLFMDQWPADWLRPLVLLSLYAVGGFWIALALTRKRFRA